MRRTDITRFRQALAGGNHDKAQADNPISVRGRTIRQRAGLVHFPIKLAGKEFLIHCWVFRQAAFDLILGAEFMVRHDLDVLMRAGCLHCLRDSFSAQFSGSRPRRDLYNSNGCVLQLRAENVVIKAGSEQLVWGRATSSDGTLSKAGTFGIISAVPSGPGSNQMLS